MPKGEREHMLEVLHLGHHSADSMLRNCLGRVFFPKIRQKLLEKYNNCQACTLCRVSRMSPKTEVDYSDVFLNYFPGQMLEMDYLEYHGDDYLSIVDVLTGFITCFKTRNKTSQEAVRCVREWTARWGRPYSIKADYGPGFRETCKAGLKKLGISLIHSSSYNPRSMGLDERSVRSI